MMNYRLHLSRLARTSLTENFVYNTFNNLNIFIKIQSTVVSPSLHNSDLTSEKEVILQSYQDEAHLIAFGQLYLEHLLMVPML